MRLRTSCKFILSILLVVSMVVTLPIMAKAVTPSKQEYRVSLNDTFDVFISNDTPLELSKGKEVYLVYTVESVDQKATTSYQHGIVASDNITERYLYEDGGVLHHTVTGGLLEAGCTYFLKYSMTEDGMECVAVRAKGDDREVIDFPHAYGDATDTYKYVGLWFGCGNVTAELSHVLCYDETGKDLGIYSNAATIPPANAFQYDTQIQHAANLSVKEAYNVGICNKEKTDSEVIFFEYTVKSSESKIYQNGVFSSTKPLQTYPHINGGLLHDNFQDKIGNGYLLEPGASYIIRIVKGQTALTSQVQRSIGGEYETYSFKNFTGSYDVDAPYVGLWFGEGMNYPVTFEIVNMKCYDESGNNLGVQFNQTGLNIENKGEQSDYTDCEAMYYSKEEDSFIALYQDKTAKVTKDGKTQEITYEIWESTIRLNFDDGPKLFEYAYQRFLTDEVVYNRLGTYYVDFKTGTKHQIERQTINEDTGYTALKPEDPVREDATFEGWVLSDGSEYDFDSIVSESITLYAKWSDEVAYEEVATLDDVDLAPIIAIASSVVFLIVAVGVSIVIVSRGGKKNVRKKEKNNG